MKRTLISLTGSLIVAAGVLFTITSANGVIHSAVGDFSMTTNTESSTWSYRLAGDTVRDGVYSLLPNFTNAAFWDPDSGIWSPVTNPNFNPGVGVNNSGSAIDFENNPWSWADGTIWMHPNPNNFVVVSWLSPVKGTADISFSVSDMDPFGGDGVNWFVDLGSSSGNLASGSFNNGGASGPQNLMDVAVTAGDRIHFIVDAKGTGHAFDSTQFTATIDAVPEPSRGVLGLTGVVAVVLRRRR